MVHLGVCDEPLPSPSVPYFTDSQLGGLPHWLAPNSTTPLCPLCSTSTYLVTQLYSPLLDSPYHRVLYLFACFERGCQNKNESWVVVRQLCEVSKEVVSVVKEEKSEVISEDWGVGDEDWGVGDDDWGGGGEILDVLESSTSTDQITKSISRLEVTDRSLIGHKDQITESYCSPFYLYVMEEPVSAADMKNTECSKYEIDDLAEGGGGGGGKEKYEKSDVKDKEFYKFYKKIRLCPEQCIRYDLGGKPLLPLPENSIPNCPLCNSPRQFEFQVMPALITILNSPSVEGAACSKMLDYRTVMVYTCKRDCLVSSCFEHVICVPEPDIQIPASHRAAETSQFGS